MTWAQKTKERLEKSDQIEKAETKREDGEDFPARAFAFVPDPEKPSTWKLRLWDSLEEKETAAQVGRAVAALGPGGFRGNRVKLPNDALAGVKRRVQTAWRKVNPDASADEVPTVLKELFEIDKGHDGESWQNDPMTLLLMAYRTLLDHPECADLVDPLMEIVHGLQDKMISVELDEEYVEEPEMIIAGYGAPTGSGRRRRRMRKVIQQKDGQFCVYSETGRSFGCYTEMEAAEARLAQIERFADRRVAEATAKELDVWHDRLHQTEHVTASMVICHDLIEDEIEIRNSELAMIKVMSGVHPVAKQIEERYTLGPVYVPNIEDAHGEFTDELTLQKALWDWVRADDRTIYLQHSEKAAGEMVEMLTWPMAIETELSVPNEGVTKYSFPENTPFMGVIWEPWAWEMVKRGELRGYSIGGKAERMEADLPEAALV